MLLLSVKSSLNPSTIFLPTTAHLLQNLRRSPATENFPIKSSFLLRICTILFQHQNSSDEKLHFHLLRLPLPSSHSNLLSIFLQICAQFPLSWRPPHRFHLFLLSQNPNFSLSPLTASKLLEIFGKSRNIDLLWNHLLFMKDRNLLTHSSLRIAARELAGAREISKCVHLFRLDSKFGNIGALNCVVEELCLRKHVDVAHDVVGKMRDFVVGDDETYSFLVVGFCRAGDLVEAGRVWNLMMEGEIEPKVDAYEEIMVTMFKSNRLEEGIRVFKLMRERRFLDLRDSSYGIVIRWSCKIGRVFYAYMVFGEMLKRGMGFGNGIIGHLVYGLLAKKRVKEAYKVFREEEEVDLSLCHGMMKGLLRMKKAGEATEVFREMLRRGIEPNMHTYIMLIQGHMGKRGRKGKEELVNFDSIFVGGLVKAGKALEASKYTERTMRSTVDVPRFDYNKFLHLFSNDEGVEMFEEVGRRLKEVGMVDLGDVFLVFGERMATRERRRRAMWGKFGDCDNKFAKPLQVRICISGVLLQVASSPEELISSFCVSIGKSSEGQCLLISETFKVEEKIKFGLEINNINIIINFMQNLKCPLFLGFSL